MAMIIEQLEKEPFALSGSARAELADRLVASLDAKGLQRIDKLWASEAKRRRDEVWRGKVKTIPRFGGAFVSSADPRPLWTTDQKKPT